MDCPEVGFGLKLEIELFSEVGFGLKLDFVLQKVD